MKAFKFAEPKGELIEIAFLPDAKGLVYILAGNEFRQNNVWLQPFDAPQAPKKIADLSGEEIQEGGGFALSPDGKSFAVAQGNWASRRGFDRGLKVTLNNLPMAARPKAHVSVKVLRSLTHDPGRGCQETTTAA